MVNDAVLSSSIRGTLNSIKRSSEAVDQTALRLSTGKRVNSVLDNSQSFFNALSLNNTASDFSRLFDGLTIATRTIQEAITGIEAIEEILDLAEVKAIEAREALEKTGSNLPNTILDDSPVGYFRLNDVDTGTALNLGTLGAGGDGTITGDVRSGDEILFYGAGGLPARFGGNTGDFIAVPVDDSINTLGPYDEKTIELIFNANTVSGRQVLFEEGGPVNNLSIYIDDGLLRVTGRTTFGSDYGPLDVSTPIEAGVSYHVALVQDANNNNFTGFLNGVEFQSGGAFIGGPIGSHPNRNAIGAIDQDIYFHDDGPGNAPNRPDGTFAFNGEISDVAFYNSIISQADLLARYEATSLPLSEQFRQETVKFLEQIETINEDTSFLGVNLLDGGNLNVDLNGDRSNRLNLEGDEFTLEALGLADINFQKPSQVEAVFTAIDNARAQIRDFGFKLTNALNVINVREDFTRDFVNTHKAGADDLTLADVNEEAANQLSAQTRLDLSTTALALATVSQATILDLFSNGTGQVI
ncbi:MAG: hypothetical protein AAF988_02835 [Pseudomonadota bacterium]